MWQANSGSLGEYLDAERSSFRRRRLDEGGIKDDQFDSLNAQLFRLIAQLRQVRSEQLEPIEISQVTLVHSVVPSVEGSRSKRQLRLIANALSRLGPLGSADEMFAWWKLALDILDRMRVVKIENASTLTDYFTVLPPYGGLQERLADLVLRLWAPAVERRVRTLFAVTLPGERLDLQYLHQMVLAIDDPRDVLAVHDKYALVTLSPRDFEDEDLLGVSTERIHRALWHADKSPQVGPMLILTSRLDRICPQIRVSYARALRDPAERAQAQQDPYGHFADYIHGHLNEGA